MCLSRVCKQPPFTGGWLHSKHLLANLSPLLREELGWHCAAEAGELKQDTKPRKDNARAPEWRFEEITVTAFRLKIEGMKIGSFPKHHSVPEHKGNFAVKIKGSHPCRRAGKAHLLSALRALRQTDREPPRAKASASS
ncbi:unnamed protein product [Bubo scandiacus]